MYSNQTLGDIKIQRVLHMLVKLNEVNMKL